MTDTWLISLHPQHADAILDGTKLFELRRSRVPAGPGDTVYCYATIPVGRVVARFTVGAVLDGHPDDITAVVRAHVPPSTLERLPAYFAGREKAWAVEVRGVRQVHGPTLKELHRAGVWPPQGWTRVKPHLLRWMGVGDPEHVEAA